MTSNKKAKGKKSELKIEYSFESSDFKSTKQMLHTRNKILVDLAFSNLLQLRNEA